MTAGPDRPAAAVAADEDWKDAAVADDTTAAELRQVAGEVDRG